MLRTAGGIILASSLLAAKSNQIVSEYATPISIDPPSVHHTFSAEASENFVGALSAVTDKNYLYRIAVTHNFHSKDGTIKNDFQVIFDTRSKKNNANDITCNTDNNGKAINDKDTVNLDIKLDPPNVIMSVYDSTSGYAGSVECSSNGSTKFTRKPFEKDGRAVFTGFMLQSAARQ